MPGRYHDDPAGIAEAGGVATFISTDVMKSSHVARMAGMLEVTLKGVWLSVKHEPPPMLEAGRGAIVNTVQRRLPRRCPQLIRIRTAAEPIGRIGDPQEVADAVVFPCSDGASFVTGAAVPVDGGWVAG